MRTQKKINKMGKIYPRSNYKEYDIQILSSCNFLSCFSYIKIEEQQGDCVNEQETLWIEHARQGDENAFSYLVESYQRPVFSVCYRMLGNSRDAEDAAQESFIRAYRYLHKYDPNRPFGTWLLSIASHYCIDRMRKRRLKTVSTDVLPPEVVPDRNAPNPEKDFRDEEKELAIQRLLENLKPTDRAAVILRYWHEYSEKEIAEVLDLTVSAVKSRLYRSRQSLADAWIEDEPSNPIRGRRPNESPAF
jgi:RNA polymerase sigma-70 factor (ECF subfamily)